VSDGTGDRRVRPIFTAPAGLHCHFPLWATDAAFIYFFQGALPDKLTFGASHSRGSLKGLRRTLRA